MNKHPNKQNKRPPRRSPRRATTVRFPLPFVMLLCWMRSYAGDEACSCGASPDYEIDSFVDAEGLLEADDPGEKDHLLLAALEQQAMGPLPSIKPSWSADNMPSSFSLSSIVSKMRNRRFLPCC